jgi:hypothetical protein
MNCQLNITVGDALSGKPSVGITNTNGSVIWSDSQALPNACAPILDPQYQGGTGGCTANPNNSLIQGPTGTLGVKVLDPSPDVPPPCSPVSPIIIDTEGEGFHLTSAENGVMFDMENSGHPLKLSWTERGSHNAFLVLDRDGSGKITSGKELFGDWTPQPRSPNPNGFLALAEFDKPENGGNSDGVIDDHDAVFSKLRLWIDENHDGVSQANELHTLPELGVYSLALRYVELRKTDRFGNEFRYRGLVNPGERRDRRDEVGRFAYDVFFVTE